MNRYSVITAVAIVVIVSPFAFSGLSILGAQQLEYRWNSPGEFSFFALSNHGEVEFCNTVPFWISLQKFEIAPLYAENHMGTYTVEQMTLNPSSSEVQQGTFRTENYSATQQVFLTFDFQFNGGEARLDPNQFVVAVQISTPIMGLIPYSTTTFIPGFEFEQYMSQDELSCS